MTLTHNRWTLTEGLEMPIVISQLKNETKEITCFVGDEIPENQITFHYFINRFTPEMESRFDAAAKGDEKTAKYIEALSDLIDGWDILDKPESEGGQIIPIRVRDESGNFVPNMEGLNLIPYQVFTSIMEAIMEDQKPKKEQETGSMIG